MPAVHKIFPSQAEVDRLNGLLSQGISFNVHDEAGQLLMHVNAVASVLNHQTTLPPVDVTLVENLPEITLDEQSDIDEARLTAIEDRLDLIEDRLTDLENP